MRIAVAGGTGVVGRYVVEEAQARGHEVLTLTRSGGADLTTGAGLADLLAGTEAVVDVTGTHAQKESEATEFFGSVTRNLLAAEASAGVGQHVALSIVGIDLVPGSGYYQGKLLQERLVEVGDVPWSVLRATQFHEFAEQALDFVTLGPLSLVPQMTTQPIAATEVGAALVDLVESGPQGRVPDLAGPEVHQLVDLSRKVNAEKGLGRRVVGVRVPGAWGRGMRSGALTPADDGPRGVQTFEEWVRR